MNQIPKKKNKKLKAIFMLLIVVLAVFGLYETMCAFLNFKNWSSEFRFIFYIVVFIFCTPIVVDILHDITQIDQEYFKNQKNKDNE